jgi:hypothetical protein
MSEEKYEIVKFIDGELELDVNVNHNDETIWLNQAQIALLFCNYLLPRSHAVKLIFSVQRRYRQTVRYLHLHPLIPPL